MKILMVLERDFPPDLRVENEIKSLIAAGNTVSLACYGLKNESAVFNWNGCMVYKKKIPKLIYKSSIGALKFPFYFNFWKNHLKTVIQETQPDAIHIHDLPLARLGTFFKKKYHLKFTLDLHENWPAYLQISTHTQSLTGKLLSNTKQWKQYEYAQCKNADHIIVVVDEAKDRLIALGLDEKKVFVVSNVPDLADFEQVVPAEKPKNKTLLFYGGGINKHRGLQIVLKGLSLLKTDEIDFEFWIFGNGNYKQSLENLVRELNIESHIKFFGNKPYKEMLTYLMAADVTLIPHIKSDHTDSTIPHKLFQYMYINKYIIASNCAPIERILVETKSGVVYKHDEPESFKNQFVNFVNSDRQTENTTGKAYVEKKYNWTLESKILETIYKG